MEAKKGSLVHPRCQRAGEECLSCSVRRCLKPFLLTRAFAGIAGGLGGESRWHWPGGGVGWGGGCGIGGRGVGEGHWLSCRLIKRSGIHGMTMGENYEKDDVSH